METIICIVYLVASYWAVGETIYANKTLIIFDSGKFFVKKFAIGCAFGIILIPIAVIKRLMKK